MLPSKAAAIRILLVDDHALFLEGIERLLEGRRDFAVIGAAQDIVAARKLLAIHPVDVLVLDFDLGQERATPVVRSLIEEGFSGRILVVTAGVSETEAVQLIRAGVAGIFLKQHGSEALCEAIRQVANGEPYLESRYVGTMLRALGPESESAPPRLAAREARILRLIFQGLTNKEIATKLDLTESGVKSALRKLFGKIGAKTRSQAVRIALENYRTQL